MDVLGEAMSRYPPVPMLAGLHVAKIAILGHNRGMKMETIADRVRTLIGRSGLTQNAFAERTGIEPSKLSKSLNGTRRFSSLDLALIAEDGKVTVDWLLTGKEPALATAARASAGSSAHEALALAEDYVGIRESLAALGYRQMWRLPHVSWRTTRWIGQGCDLAEAASAMIHDAGRSVINDLNEVIETVFGIDVAQQPLGDGFDGLAVSSDKAKFILVNTTAAATRQRFTKAHELGHLLAADDQRVHEDHDIYSETSRNGESEVRANAFAAAFLMPENLLRSRMDFDPHDQIGLCALATELRVSPSALAFRLANLHLIDEETQDRLRQVTAWKAAQLANQTASFTQTVTAAKAVRPPSSLLNDALLAYEHGDITLRLAARLLGTDTRTLRRQLAHTENANS